MSKEIEEKMLDLGLRILNIPVSKKDIPRLIKLITLIKIRGSKTTLQDVVEIDNPVELKKENDGQAKEQNSKEDIKIIKDPLEDDLPF